MSRELFLIIFTLFYMLCPCSIYYCLFRLNLSRLQNVIFLSVAYIVYYIINYITFSANYIPESKRAVYFLIASILDIGFPILIILFLTENESVLVGMSSLLIVCRIHSSLVFSIFDIIAPEAGEIMKGYTYRNSDITMSNMAYIFVLFVCMTALLWNPARWLKKKLDYIHSMASRFGLKHAFWFPYLSAIFIIFVVGAMAFVTAQATSKTLFMEFIPSLTMSLSLILVFIFTYLVIRKSQYKTELKQLQNKCDLTEKKYETLLAENDDLRKIRHELNKHLTAAKGLASFQPDSEIMQYVQEFTDAGKYLSQLSQCGNIYIDTQIEQYYKIFKEQNVIFETVLEPMLDKSEIADRLSLMLEEILKFASDDIHDKSWCRFSLRTRKGHILALMEVGFKDMREYRRRKFIDMIGNEMILRQRIKQTRIIAREMNGSTFYSLMPEKLKLAVMISTTPPLKIMNAVRRWAVA